LSFFFSNTATTEIYTLSLHDALPISVGAGDRLHVQHLVVEHLGDHRLQEHAHAVSGQDHVIGVRPAGQRELETLLRIGSGDAQRSEEHTSELQSPYDLVCRLLLEKKK